MIFDEDNISYILDEFFHRCEMIKAVGGISCKDTLEGIKVPKGWRLDHQTEYYIPPNVILDCTNND